MRHASKDRTLTGSGLPPWSFGNGSLSLSGKVETFYPDCAKGTWRGRLPVCGYPGGDPQSAMAGEAPTGVDF